MAVVSITNSDGSKITFGRTIPFPDAVREFAGDDDNERLKWLAALHLAGQGWTYTLLGRVFGYDRGHVCREVNRLLDELKARPALRGGKRGEILHVAGFLTDSGNLHSCFAYEYLEPTRFVTSRS